MSLAKAFISGKVISDPEKRRTPNDFSVTNFNLQVVSSGSGRNDSPFTVRVTCWRGLADVVADTIQRDVDVTVEGRLQINQHEGQGGMTRRTYEIDASNVYLGSLQPLFTTAETSGQSGSRVNPSSGNATTSYSGAASSSGQGVSVGVTSPSQTPQTGFSQEELLTEDDIPF